MTQLHIAPKHLEQLANEQDESAGKIDEAIAVVDGSAAALWWDHGLISFNSVAAMQRAEKERESACNNMINVCNDLSEKLRVSVPAFADTDTQTGANIDRQMR